MLYQVLLTVHTGKVFGLFVSLTLLGLSAIDPIGIAAMPILLLQKKPYERSFIFLGGSFVALMAMGILFARGFGEVVRRFESTNTWFVPTVEVLAGVVLLIIALTVFWRIKKGKLSVEPSDSMLKRLKLGNWQLFILGALLVSVQSVFDVVFVIAMIRVGQLHLSIVTLSAAVATYAIAALILQLSVVVSYKLAPPGQRTKTLDKVHHLLVNYANWALFAVSFSLGCLLLVLAILAR